MRPALVRALLGLVRRLPPPRDDAAMALLRAARDLVLGRRPGRSPRPVPGPRRASAPATSGPPAPAARSFVMAAGPPLPKASALPPPAAWKEPPATRTVAGSGRTLTTRAAPVRFDVELLEALNEEYRQRPVVATPRSCEPRSLAGDARKRVAWAHSQVDLVDRKVLEIGCGYGYEVWSMAHNLGCDAHGVDVLERPSWPELAGDRVHLRCVDLTETNPFDHGSFDRIVSYTVWEHVRHPHRLLQETYDLLQPGGLNWIRANLWAGPLASHRYRDIFFPWPHHLFSDDVIRDWDARHGRTTEGASWVNKLTWAQYERSIAAIGYRLRRLQFSPSNWDEDFYHRFESVLGRIPRWDLERDFFTAVLEKPR